MSSPSQTFPSEHTSSFVAGTCSIPVTDLYLGVPPTDLAQANAVWPAFSALACHEPRLPNTFMLDQASLFDLYASFIAKHGSADAQKALAEGKQVLVGLRVELNTRVNQGRGSFTDRLAVVWQDLPTPPQPRLITTNFSRCALPAKPAVKHATEFTVSTQPSAQYEDPGTKWVTSEKSGKAIKVKVIDKIIAPDGKVVVTKPREKWEGHDVDGDGRLDLGRLAEGTYQFYRGKDFVGGAALRPVGTQKVERDTNHDGWFTKEDAWHTPHGDTVFEIGSGFAVLFHLGGDNTNPHRATNSWSAGCQTLPPQQHRLFFETIKKNQANFYYVLVTMRN